MREQEVSLHRCCSYGSRDKCRFHCALVLDQPEANQIVRFLKGARQCDNISVVVQPVAPPCRLGSNPEMLLRSSWFPLLPRSATFLGSADAPRNDEAITRRWRGRPLPPRAPRRGFRHASTRHRAGGRTAAPARWRDRTFWSAKTRPVAHRQTAPAT